MAQKDPKKIHPKVPTDIHNAQVYVELVIMNLPTGELRNRATDINVQLMKLEEDIKDAKVQEHKDR